MVKALEWKVLAAEIDVDCVHVKLGETLTVNLKINAPGEPLELIQVELRVTPGCVAQIFCDEIQTTPFTMWSEMPRQLEGKEK